MNDDRASDEWPDDPAGGGPWSELTDDLVDLTERLRGTYRQIADESGPSEDEVKEAFTTLAGAWNQLAGAVGVAIQDDEVRRHLKKAASSLVNAVGASLAEFIPANHHPNEARAEDDGDENDGADEDGTRGPETERDA